MTPRLVATDLDGTLLRSDESLSPRSRTALKVTIAAGAGHVIVTGRSVRTAGPVFDALGYAGLAVCAQGAQIYDADTHRVIGGTVLDAAAARSAVAQLEAVIGPVHVAVARAGLDGGFFGPSTLPWPWTRAGLQQVADIDELWSESLLKAYLAHDLLDADELAAAARTAFDGQLEVFNAGGGLVEVVAHGVSKASGLADVADRLGRTAAETIAFGDMPSDVPMLEWAGHGVAMANGHPDAIAAADEVAPSNDDDGVAVILERLFPPPTLNAAACLT